MQKSLEKQSDLSALPTPEGNKRREVGLEKRSPTTVQFGAKIRKPGKPKLCVRWMLPSNKGILASGVLIRGNTCSDTNASRDSEHPRHLVSCLLYKVSSLDSQTLFAHV